MKESFSYSDMEEMLEYSKAPIIKADQDILDYLELIEEVVSR